MNTTDAMQQYLDSLSQEPGSILYRDTIDWKALPHGDQGQILTLSQDLLPFWNTAPGYRPAMMDFSQSAAAYTRPLSTSGDEFTIVGRYVTPPKVGTSARFFFVIDGGSSTTRRAQTTIRDDSHPTNAHTWAGHAWSDTGTILAAFDDTVPTDDDQPHSFLFAYQGSTGEGYAAIDGRELSPTTLTPGSLRKGGLTADIARVSWGAPLKYNGQLGYFGYHDVYIPDYSLFFDALNRPIQPDMTSWAQWGAQPKIWNEAANLIKNYGSQGSFTQLGTPFVGLGGNL